MGRGQEEFYLYERGGREVLAMLKGGGRKRFSLEA